MSGAAATNRRAWVVVAVLVVAALVALSVSPAMKVVDGCGHCGRARSWMEFPHSPWPNAAWFLRVDRAGDPACAHLYRDAQWGVAWVWPWQK